ncbi:hypothetical protein [Methanobacterium aggregans]|uniref:hypothetical protein n=1 Tax=Methanobacterium aggregans TaxID=1615586 RepID=UPI001AE96106|nr:hypothetical protein [Methanobacterium aggregans]MBP2045113.1 hypothetical protein [Methanobacterium aggregans]
MDIKRSINQYLDGTEQSPGRTYDGSYSSFDYCYNYFYSFYKENRVEELADDVNLQMSCLQIGFYLASSGMMRGSSPLLGRSVVNFKELIRTISSMDPMLWEIDLDSYTPENMELLLECREKIVDSLGENIKVSEALITRIMLGIFGNIPVFDQYFKNSLKMKRVNKRSLMKLKEFYDENRSSFDSFDVHTLDFLTAEETDVPYTKARLLDIYGYMDGQLKKPEICMDCCIDI